MVTILILCKVTSKVRPPGRKLIKESQGIDSPAKNDFFNAETIPAHIEECVECYISNFLNKVWPSQSLSA